MAGQFSKKSQFKSLLNKQTQDILSQSNGLESWQNFRSQVRERITQKSQILHTKNQNRSFFNDNNSSGLGLSRSSNNLRSRSPVIGKKESTRFRSPIISAKKKFADFYSGISPTETDTQTKLLNSSEHSRQASGSFVNSDKVNELLPMETLLKVQEVIQEGGMRSCSYTYKEELKKLAKLILS